MNSYNAEEKEALSTPLKASEMEKMVKGSTALMKELTKDLDSMETRKMKTFWKDKPFFRKHNGLDKSAWSPSIILENIHCYYLRFKLLLK